MSFALRVASHNVQVNITLFLGHTYVFIYVTGHTAYILSITFKHSVYTFFFYISSDLLGRLAATDS
jgi:hypothetical protein